MIKILGTDLDRLGIIKNVLYSNRSEEINGENILDFTTILSEKVKNLITDNSIFELKDDYFDLVYLKKYANEDDTYTVDVESAHISYRLNKPEYDVEYFTEMGTPTYILGKILEGTGFTVGAIEYTDVVTYSAQEAKSRRQLLMEFVDYIGGEAYFNKFEIGIVQHRGSTIVKPIMNGKDVRIASKTLNKRELDPQGNPLVSYNCKLVYLPDDTYSLGDEILLIQKDIDVREQLRNVRLSYDPYDMSRVEFQFANNINGIEDSIYRIDTTTITKDKTYNGTRIGPEFGFEAVRNDKKARAYFNSTNLALQAGDGTGENWVNKLYYELDPVTNEAVLVFDGELTVQLLQVISSYVDADFDLSFLGDMAYEDAVEKSKLGTTIIDGGYLKTGFVDASRIDTGQLNANQVDIVAKDSENNVVIKIGKIEEAVGSTPARYGLRLTGNNGELMVDEYGIDPRFIKAFKNLIWNSTFERRDPVTNIPQFWSGGVSTPSSSYDNTHSMKLEIGEMSEQIAVPGGLNPRPDPSWWNNLTTRLSFFKKGGDVQVQIFSEFDYTPFELTREDGSKATWYNTGSSSNWWDGKYTLSFDPTKSGRIWIRFTNIGSSAAYIDAVQLEPDFNGKYPSFYTNGPYSVSADEVPMSDTWLEYINAPYAQSISVQFNQRYSLPPAVTASILRNINAANTGSAFGNHNISPNIDLIIENEGGYLFYTGAYITFGGTAPASISNVYISVQVVGRV